MAIASVSTTAPARPLLPFRGPDGRFARRAAAPADLPPSPLLAAVGVLSSEEAFGGLPKSGEPPEAIRADLEALVTNQPGNSGLHDQVVNSDVVRAAPDAEPDQPEAFRSVDAIEVVAEPDTAAAARALHARRALEAAADHAVDLLAALGLPRLVGPGFEPIDLHAAGDALDGAIAALDEADGDADAEPWLGWAGAALGRAEMGGTSDREEEEDGDELDAGEHDTADHEGYLGWPEDVGAVIGDEAWILTADPDAELDDADLEDGDEDEDGRTPWPAPPADRAEVAHA